MIEYIPVTGGDCPPHLIRTLRPRRKAFSDPVSQEIATLLQLHPDLDDEYKAFDLRRSTRNERDALFATIQEKLGINP